MGTTTGDVGNSGADRQGNTGSWTGDAFNAVGGFLHEHGPYAAMFPAQQESAGDVVGQIIGGNDRTSATVSAPQSPAAPLAQPSPPSDAAAQPAGGPTSRFAPNNVQLAHAALICGYTAKDAPRQKDNFTLAQYFGISPAVINAREDDFYRRWVIETVRKVLPSSPEDCQAILDDPYGAPAITRKLLSSQEPASAARQADSGAALSAVTAPDNKPQYAPGTSQRIQDIGNRISELDRMPKGEVSQEEIDDVLGQLHALRKAPDLTNAEHNNLLGLGLQAFTMAASHGLKTPQETVNDPIYGEAAAGSMAFSGGGPGVPKTPASPAGPMLPRTNNTHVPEFDGIGPPVVDGAIPNAKQAYIDMKKFNGYALDPAHSKGGDKAKVFQSALGYNQSNADELWLKIQRGVTQNKAMPGMRDKHGQRYTVDMPITGPNGNTTEVRTGWIFGPGSTKARMTTTYIPK